jgi:TPP-dependent pyruvate/acetoin dehydrogenase alpha subunit
LETRVLSDREAAALEREVAKEVAEAASWAEAQPDAQPEEVLKHTWAGGAVPALNWMSSA